MRNNPDGDHVGGAFTYGEIASCMVTVGDTGFDDVGTWHVFIQKRPGVCNFFVDVPSPSEVQEAIVKVSPQVPALS